MSKSLINIRKFVESLRYLSKAELEKLCKQCGMTDREIYGVLSYVYERKPVDEIIATLGMSKGTFQSRKEVLAMRFKTFLDSIGYKLITSDDKEEDIFKKKSNIEELKENKDFQKLSLEDKIKVALKKA